MKPDFGFYYPGQYWDDSDWIKNLILFFDGIAMLIPNYMPDQASFEDYPIVSSLREHGMFKILRPEEAVGAEETKRLSSALAEIISSGSLDELIRVTSRDGDRSSFGSISMSRLGYDGDPELAKGIFNELKERRLARDSEDGVSIPMHSIVRALILVLHSQILRGKGSNMGVTLSPVTDNMTLVYALRDIVSAPTTPPSVGDIVSFDLAVVGVDLSSVPIDEILDFRQQNYAAHRDYRLSILKFAHELSALEDRDRHVAFELRQEELDDKAKSLRKINWRAWKKPATFALSAAGATVAYESGSIMSGAIAGLLAIVGLMPEGADESSVYSYLMSARQKWYV